jgi:hypothetical protein
MVQLSVRATRDLLPAIFPTITSRHFAALQLQSLPPKLWYSTCKIVDAILRCNKNNEDDGCRLPPPPTTTTTLGNVVVAAVSATAFVDELTELATIWYR